MASTPYPKIIALGGVGIGSIFDEEVEITEKLDGSQFGFGRIEGTLVCRSKGKEQDLDNPDKMFVEAVEFVKSVENKIPDNTFFYAEYLQKPQHNVLAYDNIPKNHLALFGVMYTDEDSYKEVALRSYGIIKHWAEELGTDVVPLLYSGKSSPEHVLTLMEQQSYLGGQEIEGVVVKNYKPWLFMNQILYSVMAGKYVSEKFKEVHARDWAKLNTGKGQLEVVKQKYRSDARWNKAIIHLKEEGRYTQSLKDIGELVKMVKADLALEEKENIKNDLWRILGDDVIKYSTFGLPQWYKELLLKGEADGQHTSTGEEEHNTDVNASVGSP